MAHLVVEHLTKVFREPGGDTVCAVEDLSLAAQSGEFLVLTGPSGCGKTSTLQLLAGLEEPTSGTIFLEGKSMQGVPPKDRDIAMVFQNHALYPHLTARENLAFGLKLRKCPRPEIEARVGEAAEMLGLNGCLDRKPHALSGGQRQRVALGRALVRRPKLFLFDEPLANLDPQLRMQMRAEISRLHRHLGATMIYVTHDHLEAMALGHRIAVMKDGKLQQLAQPIELYRHPANLFVAGFIGSPPMNLFPGTIRAQNGALVFEARDGASEKALVLPLSGVASAPDRLKPGHETRPFTLPLAQLAAKLDGWVGKTVVLGIRPEDIGIAPNGMDGPDPGLEAVVETVESLGAESYLLLFGNAGRFIVRLPAAESIHAEQHLRLRFEMRRAVLFDPDTGRAIQE